MKTRKEVRELFNFPELGIASLEQERMLSTLTSLVQFLEMKVGTEGTLEEWQEAHRDYNKMLLRKKLRVL